MSKLEIKKYGEPVLRKKAVSILEVTTYVKGVVFDMLETMYLSSGLGLAAPQVGISLRLCVIDVNLNIKSPIVMINPEIISCEDEVLAEEGCLSIPGVYKEIKRSRNIIVQYIDLNEKKCKIKVWNLLARVVQHEVDHLDGKLFIDYITDFDRKRIRMK
ncbi:MAG: peptide deformylase [Endomicrobium sp.]|jgi:peptide deformylase|nr:peptide deformylase [Endomicrobium sp.]